MQIILHIIWANKNFKWRKLDLKEDDDVEEFKFFLVVVSTYSVDAIFGAHMETATLYETDVTDYTQYNWWDSNLAPLVPRHIHSTTRSFPNNIEEFNWFDSSAM